MRIIVEAKVNRLIQEFIELHEKGPAALDQLNRKALEITFNIMSVNEIKNFVSEEV